jgi:hypothetical protein
MCVKLKDFFFLDKKKDFLKENKKSPKRFKFNQSWPQKKTRKKVQVQEKGKGMKRSKGIQASNHHRLMSSLLILMILLLSFLSIPSRFFRFFVERPLIISFLLFKAENSSLDTYNGE